jgi:cytochrome c biogenesis protein CcmG, thiol:disulfide interchange protein DsbE
VAALVVVVTVGGITWYAVRGSTQAADHPALIGGSRPNSDQVGKPAPDFELPGIDGGTVKLSDYRGKPVVLNFWASWCTPCREEFPLLRKTLAAHPGDFVLLGVDTKDPIRSDGRDFFAHEHARWPSGFDPDSDVSAGYGVLGLPQTFFIDAQGIIRSRVYQQLDAETFRTELAKIMPAAKR